MLDGNMIKGFQTVDYAKRFAVFLQYAKPSRTIRRIGGFVDTCVDLLLDDSAYFVEESWGYRKVLFDPWCMGNDGKFDRREEIGAKTTSLVVVPRESFVLQRHEVV